MQKASLILFIQQHLPFNKAIAPAIAEHFDQVELAKNDFFLKEGQLSDQYLFLESGFIRSYTLDTEGNEVTTNLYGNNQVVFEVYSFFNRTRSRENFQCITGCRGYSIRFETLNELFHTIPEFREFGRAILVKGYSALKLRTLSLINETAEQRYQNLVNSSPEIFQNVPLKYIASYLGITDSSLSRIRRESIKK